ncbi:VC0807 family protein [Kitasatospora sp. NPDC101155]|uniref:VC0807 family protein n=1 Tax=Kitasatospora sp. NPDC101155 TaxID=3364097 RepID=UPI0038221863
MPKRTTATPSAHPLAVVLRPLVVDVGVPLAVNYVLHSVLGFSPVVALLLSSVLPAVRTVAGLLRERRINGAAGLMLLVNAAGISLSLVSGDARLAVAKDGALSSVIGIAMVCSVFAGQPMVSTGLKPVLTKGEPAKVAAWERLSVGSARFRRAEKGFTLVWGLALLGECAARVVGAYTLPVSSMAWLSTVFLLGAFVVAFIAGAPFHNRIEKLVDAEARTVFEADVETAAALSAAAEHRPTLSAT